MIQDLTSRLGQAWALLLRYRILWLLSFLAGVLPSAANWVMSLYSKTPTILETATSCVALLVALVALGAALVLQAGLVVATDQALQGNTIILRTAWRAGVRRWWALFVLLMLLVLPVLVVWLPFFLLLPRAVSSVVATPLFIIMGIILIPAQCILVLTHDSPSQAIRHTFAVARSNITLFILLNIVLGVIGFAINLLTTLLADGVHAVVPGIAVNSVKWLPQAVLNAPFIAWAIVIWVAFYRELNPAIPVTPANPILADYTTA